MPLKRPVIATLLSLLIPLTMAHASEWPQFRGPGGRGRSTAAGVPVRWSETDSIAWKTAIAGEGYSSPVIAGNQVWLTSSHDDGKSLHAVCVDRSSGEIIHDAEVLRPEAAGPKHKLNGYASPTPVLDGDHVYVHFGARGTVCLDTDASVVWKKTDLPFHAPQGAASSPVLHGNHLILCCDGIDRQFLVALDKRTGDVLWNQPRLHFKKASGGHPLDGMAYSTPLILEVDGVTQVLSSGADHAASYDLQTGKELWWIGYKGFSLVGQPSFENGLFYMCGSIKLDHHAIYAIRPGAKGQIGKEHLVWQNSTGIPHVPTPLVVGGEIYVVHDRGTAMCLDARTGDVVWKNRLGGNFRSSPIEINGRIYAPSEEGLTVVFEAGREFNVLARNKLDAGIRSSPAVAGRSLFLRSDTHLYRIED